MVRTKGPIASVAASGTIGGVLTSSNWKGRSYTKKLTVPNNPKSGGQVMSRAMLAFLTKYWTLLSPTSKASWNDLAAASAISPYNAYLQWNLERWSRFLTPSIRSYVSDTPQQSDVDYAAAAPLQRSIRLHIHKSANNDGMGIRFNHSTSTGFSPSPDNTIAVLRFGPGLPADFYWIHANLKPGAHYYRLQTFANFGRSLDLFAAEFSAFLT